MSVTQSGKEVLTLAEIAARLGVSRRTVLRWVQEGDLPAYRIRGIIRVRPEDFEAFLARSRTTAERGEAG